MPQMERAPSPSPDESAFLSIFYPWPPYVTLGYLNESKNCARWLSCFVGQDNLLAMFHKPSSPNTIIIEIKKGLTVRKMREILGQHDWEKVFPKHDAEKEGGTHSQVFYSTFRTRRDVEKTGWKVRLVTDDWFKGFNPTSGAKVAYPYPATTFCKPPELAETVNALELFRPLPGCIFPEAGQPPAPTEGTQTPPTAPPPRNVPGGNGRAGASSGNVNASGGKGKKKVADPNVRPTAPVTRSAEASAKAKVTQSRPSGITFNAYDEDSEGDDGYGNYAMHHQYGEEEEPKRKQGHGTRNLTGRMRNAQVHGYPEDPFVHAKPQELSPDDICPFHRKPNCRPAVCEWAGKRREVERQRQNRTKGRLGQNIRRWDC